MARNQLAPVSNRDNKVITFSAQPDYTFAAADARTDTILEHFRLRRHDQPGDFFEFEAFWAAASAADALAVQLVWSYDELSATNLGTALANLTIPAGAGRVGFKTTFKGRIRPSPTNAALNTVDGIAELDPTAAASTFTNIAATWDTNRAVWLGIRVTRVAATVVSLRFLKAESIFGVSRIPPAAYAA